MTATLSFTHARAFNNLNRRLHHRFGVERGAKVFRRATSSYAPAHTRNLSIGGALLDVQSARPFTVGEIVDVGVAYRASPVLKEQAMLPAIVVRATMLDDHRQSIALRYLNPHAGLARPSAA